MKTEHYTYFNRFLLDPQFRLFRHLLLFGVINLIVLNMGFPEDLELANPRYSSSRWLVHIAYIFLFLSLFYFNIYYAVPRLLFKNRIKEYLLFFFLVVPLPLLIAITIQYLFLKGFQEEITRTGVMELLLMLLISLLNTALLQGSVTTFLLFRHWIKINRQTQEIRTATMETELNLLKSQINPHFLFNTLNNLNVLISKDGHEAYRMIDKLETLIDYQMKEGKNEKVALHSEINFLNDYLNLEKIRRDRFDFRLFDPGFSSGQSIAPLLFIPFIENAVKYSYDSEKRSYVYVSFFIEEGRLLFICINSKPAIPYPKKKSGGIGLNNIERRLSLLYPGEHMLDIKDEPETYTVKLNIPI